MKCSRIHHHVTSCSHGVVCTDVVKLHPFVNCITLLTLLLRPHAPQLRVFLRIDDVRVPQSQLRRPEQNVIFANFLVLSPLLELEDIHFLLSPFQWGKSFHLLSSFTGDGQDSVSKSS